MTANGRCCPRCDSPRVDGTEGEDYECATCGEVFADPLNRENPRPFQRHNLSDAGRTLESMSPDEWPAGGGRGE